MTKAVIFDMDGVVVNSMTQDFLAWEKIFKEGAMPFSNDLFKSFFGMKSKEIIKKYVKKDASEKEAEELGKGRKIIFLCLPKKIL